MDIVQMLNHYAIREKPVIHTRRRPKGDPSPQHVAANAGKIDAARKRYKAVMRDEWVPTPVIEKRLGMGPGTILLTLRNFERRGELQCRPRYNESRTKRNGLEWKWI
jgi:hypothetical protein